MPCHGFRNPLHWPPALLCKHNLLHPDELISADGHPVPAALFAQPEIASVGATEEEWARSGRAVQGQYAHVAYGWALEEPPGFCTVLVDPSSGKLLGAHILGPQASILIRPLVPAMTLGLDTQVLTRQPYWIHLALTEVVQNALLDLDE